MTIRFLKPRKLGLDAESWLRQEVCIFEWMATTWWYLTAGLRFNGGVAVTAMPLLRRDKGSSVGFAVASPALPLRRPLKATGFRITSESTGRDFLSTGDSIVVDKVAIGVGDGWDIAGIVQKEMPRK